MTLAVMRATWVVAGKALNFQAFSATLFFFFIRMLFFRPRLNILIFLPILGRKYSCIILKLVYVFCAEYCTYVLHVPFIELSSALNILL